ncbi:uncharacterized protein VTP21DRAFT_2554 [Calcarisporiella thermophila]|uniref:uncharacterized protein n=1 Tax=Calcarisporiella thermophila TaxID=911321 RepID=UPI003744786F
MPSCSWLSMTIATLVLCELQTMMSCNNTETWLIEDLLMEPVKPTPKVSNSRTFKVGVFYGLYHFSSASLAVGARKVFSLGSLGRLGQFFQALLHAPPSEVKCAHSLVTATGSGDICEKFTSDNLLDVHFGTDDDCLGWCSSAFEVVGDSVVKYEIPGVQHLSV